MTEVPSLPHVFVVTYGRSGSTVLQSLLNSIPGYQIRGENKNALLGLYQHYRSLKEMVDVFGKVGPRRPDDPWYGADMVDLQAYFSQIARHFTASVLNPAPGVRVTGFKEISYFEEPEHLAGLIDFVAQYFAPAKFVFNIRHFEDVMRSGWWKDQDKYHVVGRLSAHTAQAIDLATSLGDRAYLVRYEDYTQDPESLRPLFAFLGEPFDRQSVERVLATRLYH